MHDVGAIERGAQDGGVRHLPAVAAADAALVDGGDGIFLQGIVGVLHAERRASRKANAGVVAGAHVLVDAEARLHHALPRLDRLLHQGALAPLAVQHAFGRGDDDLGPLFARGQRLLDGIPHAADVVGARDLAHPCHADAFHRLRDRMLCVPRPVIGARGEKVLPARRRRVVVVDDDGQRVGLVEHRVADARREAVVPEAAVAHDGDGLLLRRHVEGGSRRGPQAITHRRRADVEGCVDREQMAADIRRDVMRPELFLDQLERRENRPLRTARAETRRPWRHHVRQRLHLRMIEHALHLGEPRVVADQAARGVRDE